MPLPNLSVDGARLWRTLMVSGEIGKGESTGLRRLTLTDADREIRDQLARWAHEGGYGLAVDGLGNMFVRREGTDAALPPVLIGSHLDTQWAGGRFDGILGVLAGLEVLRTLDDAGIETRRPIELVNWTNEEGARFHPPMLCSLVWSGKEPVSFAYDRRDKEGLRFEDELARIGYKGEAPVGGRAIDAYFELHIEQGPKLDAARVPVGIVTGGYATRGFRIRVEGETSHVGPTPMQDRHNALVGASMVAVAVNEIGWRQAPSDGKTTAARLDLIPNLPGIISRSADLYVDMRHPDPAALLEMVEELETALPLCAKRSQCAISIAESWGFGGLAFDPDLVALLRRHATALGVATMDIRSQAGHDAYNVATVAPACMIFTPCEKGISHNEAENITLEDTLPGVNLLLNAVLERADR